MEKLNFNDFLIGVMQIKRKDLIKLILLCVLINNMLLFTVGYISGYISGTIIGENLYEQKLIMRDFNITNACVLNLTESVRLGTYTKTANNMLNTGTLPEQTMVCNNTPESLLS
jgi:hypothetical protein